MTGVYKLYLKASDIYLINEFNNCKTSWMGNSKIKLFGVKKLFLEVFVEAILHSILQYLEKAREHWYWSIGFQFKAVTTVKREDPKHERISFLQFIFLFLGFEIYFTKIYYACDAFYHIQMAMRTW